MTWYIYTRDAVGNRQGEIDDYTDLEMIPVWNDVGTWTMTISALSRQFANLMQPGWGIIAVRDGLALFSGPVLTRTYTVDATTNMATISGVTDDVWLKRRVVSPDPTLSGPPYNTHAYDVRTGVGSTVIRQYASVNLGPGAIPARQLPGLTMGTDPVTGATVSGNGRWDNLLVFLQALALSAGVGFRIIQVGNGLQFQVFGPNDRSASVKFSTDLGNLTKFEYSITAPTGNYVYVGGDGTDTARAIIEQADPEALAVWGRIEGDLVSVSGTTDPVVMGQSATTALDTDSAQVALNITPTDVPTCLYGVHYFLGDTVTIQMGQPIWTPYGVSGQIVDQVQKVDIHLTATGPQTTTPLVANGQKQDVIGLFRQLRFIKRRLNNLERY